MKKLSLSDSPMKTTKRKENQYTGRNFPKEENNQSDLENILALRIDEDYIISMTGVKDVSRVEYISLQIDTAMQSLLDLPDLLPSLKHLVLDNSSIGSIRDLGVGLRQLTSLSLSSCGIHDIDGIGVLVGLQELNLSDNYVSDITPLTMHENLQNINLAGNKIVDLSFGNALATCVNLRSLFLNRNPIERIGPQKYRSLVVYFITSLEMLDGLPADNSTSTSKKMTQSVLEEIATELKVIFDEMEEENRLETDLSLQFPTSQSFEKKKFSAPSVNTSTQQQSSLSSSLNGELIPDTGSELTHGSSVVLAGNVAAAMRKRRNHQQPSTPTSLKYPESNSNRSSQNNGEFESALSVLDTHLKDPELGTNPSSTRTSQGSSFLKEGDITDTVLGLSSPVRKLHGNARVYGEYNDLELNPEYLTSPNVKSKAGVSHSHRQQPPSFNGGESMMFGDPETATLLSATRRPQSAFTGTTLRFSEKSHNNNESNRQSLVSSNWSSMKGDNFSPRASASASIMPSPRQNNSSRPQSAVNNVRENSLFDTLKFSFTNSSNANSRQQSARERRRASTDSDSEDDDDEEDVGIANSRNIRKIVPMAMKNKEDDAIMLLKTKLLLPPSSNGTPASTIGSSIVHLDIVKRSNDRPSTQQGGGRSGNNSENNTARGKGGNSSGNNTEYDVDDEDIAITHSERFKMMSSSSHNANLSLLKTRQSVLLKLQSKEASSREKEELQDVKQQQQSSSRRPSSSSSSQEQQEQLFRKTSMSQLMEEKSNNSMNSQVGMSLGFNLAGSLAAIDQWVQDMSSSEEEENEEETGRNSNKIPMKIQLLSQQTSYNKQENSLSNRTVSLDQESSSNLVVPSLKDKILSRDTILTMCTNSSNPTPRQYSDRSEDISFDNGRIPEKPNCRSTSKSAIHNNPKVAISRSTTALPSSGNNQQQSRKSHLPSDNLVVTSDFEERLVVPSTHSILPKKPLPSSNSGGSGNNNGFGKGTLLSNEEIIELLRKPPKSVPMLRTKTSFQEFFKGIDRQRFQGLLHEAFNDIGDLNERENKVHRRMELMESL